MEAAADVGIEQHDEGPDAEGRLQYAARTIERVQGGNRADDGKRHTDVVGASSPRQDRQHIEPKHDAAIAANGGCVG